MQCVCSMHGSQQEEEVGARYMHRRHGASRPPQRTLGLLEELARSCAAISLSLNFPRTIQNLQIGRAGAARMKLQVFGDKPLYEPQHG
jgi:hypothetical protein